VAAAAAAVVGGRSQGRGRWSSSLTLDGRMMANDRNARLDNDDKQRPLASAPELRGRPIRTNSSTSPLQYLINLAIIILCRPIIIIINYVWAEEGGKM